MNSEEGEHCVPCRKAESCGTGLVLGDLKGQEVLGKGVQDEGIPYVCPCMRGGVCVSWSENSVSRLWQGLAWPGMGLGCLVFAECSVHTHGQGRLAINEVIALVFLPGGGTSHNFDNIMCPLSTPSLVMALLKDQPVYSTMWLAHGDSEERRSNRGCGGVSGHQGEKNDG